MSKTELIFSQQDHTLVDLSRLLNSLERTLLAPHADPSLQRSSYQRTRVGANIEYAHNLILQLEHANLSQKAQSQRSRLQHDLQQKRALLKKLQDRLYELTQLDDESLDSWASEDLEEEDLLGTYASGIEVTHSITDNRGDETAAQPVMQEKPNVVAESHLRSRRNLQNGPENKASTSGAAVDDRRDFKLGKSTTTLPPEYSRSDGEVLLSHHASEQESLTNSLLKHAIALKTSAKSFSDTLSSSNPLLDQTTAALDRNVGGMAAAERRMGMLRRMTEGRGWWARLSLYAKVAVLWVVLILIMFVMPKLRF